MTKYLINNICKIIFLLYEQTSLQSDNLSVDFIYNNNNNNNLNLVYLNLVTTKI